MNMDAYHHIQLGSVYRGHESLSSDEVEDIYNGTHVPLYIMDDHMHREGNPRNLVHFLDSFSVPEVALFADISDVRQSLIIQAYLLLILLLLILLHLFLLTSSSSTCSFLLLLFPSSCLLPLPPFPLILVTYSSSSPPSPPPLLVSI